MEVHDSSKGAVYVGPALPPLASERAPPELTSELPPYLPFLPVPLA